MNKKLLLLIAIFIGTYVNYAQVQQCQNLQVQEIPSTCSIPFTKLVATFLDTEYRDTDSYLVNGEAPCPPLQASPTSANISPDDAWAPIVFNMGFTFCYYGNMYDQLIVSGNGVVSFDLDIVQDYLITNPNGNGPFHVWNTNAALDLPSPQLQPNAIFGPYTDPNPATAAIPTETIKFDIINQDQSIPANVGNRVFVIEYDVPLFSCSSEFLHSRIKLYETSNVIDVEILEKGRCDNWENSIGIVGIQNKSATRATTVAGRTNADGGWWVNGDPAHGGNVADQELWRFVPNGDLLAYNFAWYEDSGNGFTFVSGDPTINVAPTTQTTYKAELTFQGECTFTPSTLFEEIIVDPLQNVENIQLPDNLIACETVVGGGTADFNLDQEAILLADYPTADWSNFEISYHITQDDANTSSTTNPIAPLNPYNSSNGTTIYVRIQDPNDTACYVPRSFTLTVSPIEDSSFNYPNNIFEFCLSDLDPIPTTATSGGTFTINNGGVIDANTGQLDIAASGSGTDNTGNFTITHTTSATCFSITELNITIISTNDASFTYPTTVCIDENNPTATATNTGGTFTVNNGATIDAATGELDLTTTTIGTTYLINYEFTGNCPDTNSNNIMVIGVDDSSFTFPNNVIEYCDNEPNPTPTTVTNGGTFTINNGGVIDNTTGQVNLINSSLGNDNTGIFTISYTTAGACTSSTDLILTIFDFKDASFTYPTNVCFDTNNPIANPAETGGTFTVNNGATIDAATGELDLTTTTAGTTYIINYEFTGNCPDTASQSITVNETPTANPTIPINSCENGDGTATFDISGLESVIVGSQTGLIVTYHETENDAIDGLNALTLPIIRVTGNIFVRVENANGCFTTLEIPLVVEGCFVILPEGFSPSSNVIENQTFNTADIRTRFPKFELYIYNRLGNIVYSGNASKPDWNGKRDNDGELLPSGTYFYGMRLNDEQEIKFRGWVYLQK